ncbi:MAG: hypothetical protein IKP15_06230 [Bacteroidales bacterium]|nr:hypothetical protein [Bacteroidales bacterium]
MKKTILLLTAFAGAMIWSGCVKETLSPKEEEPRGTTWTITVRAEKADGPQTKGLEIGDGTEATTTQMKSIWKAGEEVKVYLDGVCIGTLTATPDGLDAHKATLSGDITTTGIVANTTTLTLLTPRESWDYTGQVGKLLLTDDATDSIEKKFHYTMASNVLVTDVSGNNITTEDASFLNQQSIYRLSFKYAATSINAKSVTISGAAGELVQSQNVTGTAVTKGDISVTLGSATSDPFFVALRNGDETNAEAFTFTVVDNDGVTYRGTKEIPVAAKGNGTFVSMKNTALPQRLDLLLSATEVTTAL